MNVPELHRRASRRFGELVHLIKDDQWKDPTPCADWNVRELVNHVVAENLWTPPLLEGRSVEEVGEGYDGDVLGDNAQARWDEASSAALQSVQGEGAMERTVHLSFGDVPGKEYASQLFADHLIHSWDLARAIDADDKLDPDLVEACSEWFASMEAIYRAAGAIGERPDVPSGADSQTRLLATFGRKP